MSKAAKLFPGKNTPRREILKIRLSAAVLDVNLAFLDPEPDSPEAAFPPPVLVHEGKYQVNRIFFCDFFSLPVLFVGFRLCNYISSIL